MPSAPHRPRSLGPRLGAVAVAAAAALALGTEAWVPPSPDLVPPMTESTVPAALWEPSPSRASFALRWGARLSPLRVASTTVLPGETLRFRAVDRNGMPLPSVVEGAPHITSVDDHGWSFTPDAGPALYPLVVSVPELDEGIRLNVFAGVPRDRVHRGSLNGYAIGDYPPPATIRGVELVPPSGFVEVTAENAGTLLSPHFTLAQFVCKQSGGFPKYVVLDDRLPLKLEALLERVRSEGIEASSLHVMSAYRTPAYNRGLGNVDYSRHLWGEAADVFVDDSPRDGTMDDLNGDGRVDRRDADWLAEIAASLEQEAAHEPLIGGIGRYDATAAHGPFVHVDVRGHAARW